jgi:zinc transport system substrate-binding protein
MKMIVMPSPTRTFLAAVAALVCATLAGCGDNGGTGSDSGAPAAADKVKVVASFYPLEFVTEKVGGDQVDVTNLTAPGVEPHDLELTPKQVGTLTEAKLIVYEKGLQPAVDESIEQNAKQAGFDVSTAAKLIDTGAEHAHEGEEGQELAEEEKSELDPHFWLDPTRLADVADAVAAKLGEADSAHADGYKQRATELRTQLTSLDQEFKTGLANCSIKAFITAHEAFGYLAKRYGLEMIGIAGLTPDAEPSAARIKEIQHEVEHEKVTTIFYEELVSPKVAQAIARDLKLKTAVLSPVEGPADDGSSEDYLSLMRHNLQELRKANSCT